MINITLICVEVNIFHHAVSCIWPFLMRTLPLRTALTVYCKFFFYVASFDFQRDKKRMFQFNVCSKKERNEILTYFKVS